MAACAAVCLYMYCKRHIDEDHAVVSLRVANPKGTDGVMHDIAVAVQGEGRHQAQVEIRFSSSEDMRVLQILEFRGEAASSDKVDPDWHGHGLAGRNAVEGALVTVCATSAGTENSFLGPPLAW